MGSTCPIVLSLRKFCRIPALEVQKNSQMTNMRLRTSSWVTSDEGRKVQKQLWSELGDILDRIQLGIMGNV